MSDRERYSLTGLLIGLAVLGVLTRTVGQTAAEIFVLDFSGWGACEPGRLGAASK